MNVFILACRLIKQRFINIVILAVELALACIVMMGIFGLMLDKLSYGTLASSLADEKNFYFVAFGCYDKSFNILDCFPEDETVEASFSEVKTGAVNSVTGLYLHFLSYDDFLLAAMDIQKRPEDFSCYEKDGFIPAVGLDSLFEKGDIIETVQGDKIIIFDTFDSNRKVFSFSHYSSKTIFSIDSLVSNVEETKLIIPQMYLNENWQLHSTYFTPCGVVSINADSQKRQELVDLMTDFGSVIPANELSLNFEKERRNEILTNVALLIVFTIIATVGIIGINNLWLKKNEKRFAIMYISGMNGKMHWLIVMLESITVFVLGFTLFVIGLLCFKSKLLPFDFGKALLPIILFVFVFLALIYWLTSYRSYNSTLEKNLIEIYKRDNYGY